MCNGLFEAGAEICKVYDKDSSKVEVFIRKYPSCEICQSADDILKDPSINMVVTAAVPAFRSEIELLSLKHGKHVFADKPAMTSLKQLFSVFL